MSARPKTPWETAAEILLPGDVDALREAGLEIVWRWPTRHAASAEDRYKALELGLSRIDGAVSAHCSVPPTLALMNPRKGPLSKARWLCMTLARELGCSWDMIGEHYGIRGRNAYWRTMVYQQLITTDPTERACYEAVKLKLKEQTP